jgi:hypothetical protein
MKNIIAVLLIIAGFQNLKACDICGCSSGSMSGGLFPQVQNNMIGLRYQPSRFYHPTNPPNMNGLSQVKTDYYHDSEVFMRWFPKKWMQLWVNIPYRIHIREESLRTTTIQGVGDVQVNALFTLLRKDSSAFRHLILAGGGLGLPTGKYMQRDETLSTLPIGFQVGTGSWSGSISALYMLRFKKFGYLLQGDGRTYSENENLFTKGNVFVMQTGIFRQFPLGKKAQLFAHVGYRMEYLDKDIEFGNRKIDSGSSSNWATTSIELFTNKISCSLQYNTPLSSVYNGNQPVQTNRFAASISYMW